MSPTILAAGDHFVLPSLFVDALRAETGKTADIRELTLPWPDVPFSRVAEVDEASGTEEDMIAALDGIKICMTQMGPLTVKVLAASPTLRLYAVGRGGPVNVNVPAATERGVAVCFAPGRNATATAEHAVALLLAAVRQIPQRQAELLAGDWRGDFYRYSEVGPELAGTTVGLVGFGAIGSRVARMLTGFGSEVVVFDPYADPAAMAGVARRVDTLDELLGQSLIVSVHARLTPETTGLIGADQLALMPSGGVLINAARGGLVDYDAVCDALESGRLHAAGFDVFPTEPLPADHRLRKVPNVVMTPHLAGASKPTAHNAAAIVAADVARFQRRERLLNCVNPAVLER